VSVQVRFKLLNVISESVKCLTSCYTIFLTLPIKKFFVFIESESSLCRSQWPRCLGQSTLFARSNDGIAGSNPTQGMDVCIRLFCVCAVLCVRRGLATG
jgi:hypothetical protein